MDREDQAKLFLKAHGGRTTEKRHKMKQRKLTVQKDIYFSLSGSNTRTGSTKRLWHLPPWRYSKSNKTNSWAT